MNKGTHFIGQPLFGQLINLLDKGKIAKISRKNGGEMKQGLPCFITSILLLFYN